MIIDKRVNYDSTSRDDDNCTSCIYLTFYDVTGPNEKLKYCKHFGVEFKGQKYLGGISNEGVCDLFKRDENDRPKGEIDKERAKEMAEKERLNMINIFDVLRIIERERPEDIDDTKGNLLIDKMKKEVTKLRG